MGFLKKLIYGVGVNDVDYTVHVRDYLGILNGKKKYKTTSICPFYRVWNSMLERGYSEKLKAKFPTYKDVSVCKDWHLFSTFKVWMETQDWEGKQLDKDILVYGNKIYSPESCVFVTHKVNCFILEAHARANGLPVGVHWCKLRQMYKSQVSTRAGRKSLGIYDCPLEAGRAWLSAKKLELNLLVEDMDDQRLIDALLNRYSSWEVKFNAD